MSNEKNKVAKKLMRELGTLIEVESPVPLTSFLRHIILEERKNYIFYI